MLASNNDRTPTQDEFFTSPDVISIALRERTIGDESYIDRNAGHGAWLCAIRDIKIANGISKVTALSQLYMGELFEDNCIQAIKNLYGPGDIEVLKDNSIPTNLRGPGLIAMFKHNGNFIPNCVQCDALEYSWNFGFDYQPQATGKIQDRSDLFEF